MGLLARAANRFLRTPNWTLSSLAQEIYAALSSDAPVDIDSPVQATGDVIFNGGPAAGGISITKQEGGGTAINFGPRTNAEFSGPTNVAGDFVFSPQRTTVVNEAGDSVTFDEYIKAPAQQPQQAVSGDNVLFGTVASDSAPGSTTVEVTLEGDERTFVDARKVTVRLFKMHPEGVLHQGDPLTVFLTRGADGSITYRAQPPTWLG